MLNTDIFARGPRTAHISPVQYYLNQVHEEFKELKDGAVATYIPELAKANPDWFGICLVTCTGSVYEAGDSAQPFTIQSISKPFVYGMALEDHGRARVVEKVGVEPTGDAFNSISLDPGTGRPRNPMINAGAIASAGLVSGRNPASRLQAGVGDLLLYAGRTLELDMSVYRSESETGHRNRAIGYMLRNFEILTEDPVPTVEQYFQQCSIAVTCRDLGIMAATLANRGVNPVTGKQAIRGEYVESVLSVMSSCGMYDYAGEWIYRIGMPAKSGVAGGVIAVLPGHLGIGVFSPRLDARGNSVRGIAVCDEFSRRLDLHMFNRPSVGRSCLRLKTTAAEFSSNRVRTAQEAEALHNSGDRIHLYKLQGNLVFATAEHIVGDVMQNLQHLDFLLLDFKQVLTVNESASRLFFQLLQTVRSLGKEMVFVRTETQPLVRRYMKAKLGAEFEQAFRVFDDADLALEWCENRLLESRVSRGQPLAREGAAEVPREAASRTASFRLATPNRTPGPGGGFVRQEDYELFRGFTSGEIAQVLPLLERCRCEPGEVIIQQGDQADTLYLLARGQVSVWLPQPNGGKRRLATISAGMAFGELAIIDRAPRSALVLADTEVECDRLSLDAIQGLEAKDPKVKLRLLENLALGLCVKLRKANRQLAILD